MDDDPNKEINDIPSNDHPPDLNDSNNDQVDQEDASQQPSSLPNQQEATIKGKRKPTRPPSIAWDHFTKSLDGFHATCNYCAKQYACDSKKNGTSNLLSHLTHACPTYPNREPKKQKTLAFQPKKSGEGGGSTLVATSYSVDRCRDAIARILL